LLIRGQLLPTFGILGYVRYHGAILIEQDCSSLLNQIFLPDDKSSTMRLITYLCALLFVEMSSSLSCLPFKF